MRMFSRENIKYFLSIGTMRTKSSRCLMRMKIFQVCVNYEIMLPKNGYKL